MFRHELRMILLLTKTNQNFDSAFDESYDMAILNQSVVKLIFAQSYQSLDQIFL